VNLPNVWESGGCFYFRQRYRDAAGKRRVFYLKLPAPTDPAFAEAYARASGGSTKREAAAAGSLEALIVAYRAHLPERRTRRGEPLSPVTLANYQRNLDLLVQHFGRAPVRQIAAPDVVDMQDVFAGTPGVANNVISVLRAVLEFGRLRGWLEVNPAVRIPPIPLGEHAPWPAEVIEAALEVASPMYRLAIVSGLCSGWRDGDLIRVRHNWFDGGFCTVVEQGKTHVSGAVPVHPVWQAEIAKVAKKAVTLLYDRSGKPFASVEPIQAAMRRLMQEPKVRAAIAAAASRGECKDDATFVFHGLRKNACCYLAEMGLSDQAIGGMLGMSPQIVAYYSRRKRSLMIARAAAETVMAGNVVGLWKQPGINQA